MVDLINNQAKSSTEEASNDKSNWISFVQLF
jgi:hypothetical protein